MNTTSCFISILLASCLAVMADNPYASVTNVDVPMEVETNLMTGTYYTGDGVGYNLKLMLTTNMTYSCTWHGCLGVYGTATGTWTVTSNTLHLTAETATDMLKEKPLPPLDVLIYQEQYIFVDPAMRDIFIMYGPNNGMGYNCFMKDEARTKRFRATLPPIDQVIKYERYDSEKKWREVSKTDGDLILSCLNGIDSFKTWGSTLPRGKEALPIPAALGFRIVSTSGTTNVIYFSSRGQLVECPIRGLLVVPDEEEGILAQLLAKWREADNKRIASQPLPCQYRIGSADDGNTLSGIARLFYGDATKWPKIYEGNKVVLKNPDIILDGTIITIPKLNE